MGNPSLDESKKTYTQLGYANGPGGLRAIRTRNLTDEETSKKRIYICNQALNRILCS
jgi:hypothetical protein